MSPDAMLNIGEKIARYLPVIEKQYARPEFAAVRLSIERLVGSGIRLEHAKMMAAVIFSAYKERSEAQGLPLDFDAYVAELALLTEPAWRD